MSERLVKGRDRRPGDVDPDAGALSRLWQRRKARRAATKRRVAAMSPGRRWLRRGGIAATWFLGLVSLMCIAALVMFYAFTDVPRPEDVPLKQIATIEYSDGSVMARVGQVDRTIVSLNKVPDSVRWAVIAAEDRGFYSEPGVSIKGTLRAAVSDVFGGDTQGGSGITQQYVKNTYLTAERSLSRKLKELMIAIKLSREYSKNQILEYYLNTVYFGRGAYGVAAAARAYFNKDITKIDTAQAAVLAALLRDPNGYDPAQHPQAAHDRWNYVLDGMVSIKHLTAEERATMQYPAVKPPDSKGLGTTGPTWLLVNRVFAELQAHGISENDVYDNGLVIRTTIDRRAQRAATNAIDTTFADLTPQQRSIKKALVAVNPANGAVLAYYGGTGLNVKGTDGKVDYNDYASQGLRPPGSSFKPYTLATVLSQTLKKRGPGYAINSYVDGSVCTTIQGIQICNDPSDKPYSSPSITIANAMKFSLNTTFDELAAKIGPNKVATTAHTMGVQEKGPDGTPTLANKNGDTGFGIGIGDYPVTVLDQADGFATLANGGVANDAYFVQSATTSGGQTYYQHESHPTRAIDKRVANDVTLTLEPVAQFSGFALDGGRVCAAKTGTKDLNNGNDNSDAWTVGYTPQVSAAVWVGTGYSRPIKNASGGAEYGKDLPGRTWKAFMDGYLANKPMAPMATTQQIQPAPGVSSQPSYTPPPSTPPTSAPSSAPSKSSSAPPTSSPVTSSSAPTLPPPPSSSSSTTTPAPGPTTQANCGGLLQPTCPPTPPGGG